MGHSHYPAPAPFFPEAIYFFDDFLPQRFEISDQEKTEKYFSHYYSSPREVLGIYVRKCVSRSYESHICIYSFGAFTLRPTQEEFFCGERRGGAFRRDQSTLSQRVCEKIIL